MTTCLNLADVASRIGRRRAPRLIVQMNKEGPAGRTWSESATRIITEPRESRPRPHNPAISTCQK
jgi:hypothetical protein